MSKSTYTTIAVGAVTNHIGKEIKDWGREFQVINTEISPNLGEKGVVFTVRILGVPGFSDPREWTVEVLFHSVRVKLTKGPLTAEESRHISPEGEIKCPWFVTACWIAIRRYHPKIFDSLVYGKGLGMGQTHLRNHKSRLLRTLLQTDTFRDDIFFFPAYVLAAILLEKDEIKIGSERKAYETISVGYADYEVEVYREGEYICGISGLLRQICDGHALRVC